MMDTLRPHRSRPGRTPAEERIADPFDAQVDAPPLRSTDGEGADGRWAARAGRWDRARRPIALAAAVAAVLVIGALVWWRPAADRSDVVSAPSSVAPQVFDVRVDQVCTDLAGDRAGTRPRFDTLEARQVAARSRIAAVDRARGALLLLAEPTDEPTLPGQVADDLVVARTVAQSVLDARTAAAAAERWSLVDPAIDRAIAPLARHGASSCRT
ncbi:hypothetical protein [Dermatobacter hominis]|uniref:hypothetical protein n=1 Tax=Dermatobacter hominis TaxID=2884263 RepID=UPI001D12A4DC|nr:hypothetical protein [Dermatobacter hominis]UDY37967.1 hypothetical protein LH044_10580 [Dermatobacter hominis]